MLKRYLLCLLALGIIAPGTQAEPPQRPQTRQSDQSDDYHGTVVKDPYRWLEDDNSAETAAWVGEQNKVTFGYLEAIPFRNAIKDRLLKLINYPRYGLPFHYGDRYFFSKNDGLQKQAVWYVQKGLNGTPEVLIDPNQLSADGTTSLSFITFNKAGTLASYGQSVGGSDWKEIHVLDVDSKKVLEDKVEWAKVTGAAWAGDGFYYSRYDAPADGHLLSAKNENHKIYFHKVGTPQSQDRLIYDDPKNLLRFHSAGTSEDERYLFVDISDRGSGKDGNAILYQDLSDPNGSLKPLIADITDDQYSVVDEIDGKFLVETNKDAPRGRLVLIDPATGQWKDVIPQGPDVLSHVSSAGHKLFAHYLKDVSTHIKVYSMSGQLENEVELPGLGTASGFGGWRDDTNVFYSFSSYNYPATIFNYDIQSKKSTLFRKPELAFEPTHYEVEQVFYQSKDGTKVPMFLVHKKGLKKDGNNPVLLYGYGGFNISMTPGFSSSIIALLDEGFIYAVANLRGGAEYGEDWHRAGMLLNKHKVFEDFIAAAEYLISQKYTNPDRLGIQGGSNGGLLVGAVMNMRPDLFKVGLPGVGVMDMLRFHRFTIGWNWKPEYGSSEDPVNFKNLYSYSPLHNLQKGKRYPATMITTADHDDRVVPAHSFKYAAAMQATVGNENPVLIRIDTKSGHGASNLLKGIDLAADQYAFLMYNLGFKHLTSGGH
ncbi:MAG: prolyl oligopeptidase family serine peptidase [Vulcanimicrobiota bacterium]